AGSSRAPLERTRDRPPPVAHVAGTGNLTAPTPRTRGRTTTARRSILVLEGELHLRPVGEDLPVLQVHIELRDLGDAQIAKRLRRLVDRRLGRLLPRISARPDELDDLVHALRHSLAPPRGGLHSGSSRPRTAPAPAADVRIVTKSDERRHGRPTPWPLRAPLDPPRNAGEDHEACPVEG